MDHKELRSLVSDFYRQKLHEAKQRIDVLGPVSDAQRKEYAKSQTLLEQGNSEFWKLLGSDYANTVLDEFFKQSGLDRSDYSDMIPMIFDELRKGQIGANNW